MKIVSFVGSARGVAWLASLALHAALLIAGWPQLPSTEMTGPASAVITVRLDTHRAPPVPPSPQPLPQARDADDAQKQAPAAERAPARASVPSTQRADQAVHLASAPEARAEPFLRPGELTRLPRLPGEPLIDLGPEALQDGTLSLRMRIDANGRVVDHRIEEVTTLSDDVIERLRSAFVRYTYLPAEVAGRPVACEVVLRLAVRDGAASALGVR